MVKNDSLSGDLNLVKEFEELKLKQKLLIDSLSRKNKTEMNVFLVEINSKLDFLVKIFKETQKEEKEGENENPNEYMETKFKEMIEKIDSFQEDFKVKLEEINKKFSDIEKPKKSLEEFKLNVTPIEVENSKSELPPKPDFEVDESIKNNNNEDSNQLKEGEKKNK